jgi:hypothetical protein
MTGAPGAALRAISDARVAALADTGFRGSQDAVEVLIHFAVTVIIRTIAALSTVVAALAEGVVQAVADVLVVFTFV